MWQEWHIWRSCLRVVTTFMKLPRPRCLAPHHSHVHFQKLQKEGTVDSYWEKVNLFVEMYVPDEKIAEMDADMRHFTRRRTMVQGATMQQFIWEVNPQRHFSWMISVIHQQLYELVLLCQEECNSLRLGPKQPRYRRCKLVQTISAHPDDEQTTCKQQVSGLLRKYHWEYCIVFD